MFKKSVLFTFMFLLNPLLSFAQLPPKKAVQGPNLISQRLPIHNLKQAVNLAYTSISGDYSAFCVSEAAQGENDLNGDGNNNDCVMHTWHKGELNNHSGAIKSLFSVVVPGMTAQDKNYVVYLVNEQEQGNTDLNGDGDTLDLVLHVADSNTGNVVNTGLATYEDSFKIHAPYVVIQVSENLQNADLNGDGDKGDPVVHLYNISTDQITNLGHATTTVSPINDHFLAIKIMESQDGNQDLNNDGDTDDFILFVYNLNTSAFINTLQPGSEYYYEPIELHTDDVSFLLSEYGSNQDLNGDGDLFDHFPAVYTISTGNTVIFPYAATSLAKVSGDYISAIASEYQQNADLNGDGDKTDEVLVVYKKGGPAPAVVATTSKAILQGPVAAFSVSEVYAGFTDLNGDGDFFDSVLFTYDIETQTLKNVGLNTESFGFSNDTVIFSVNEQSQNQDLDGDGLKTKQIAFTYNVASEDLLNLKLNVAGSSFLIHRDWAMFSKRETSTKHETILFNTKLNKVVPTKTYSLKPIAPEFTSLAAEYNVGQLSELAASFVVNEALQQEDLNQDGDLLDNVLHQMYLK